MSILRVPKRFRGFLSRSVEDLPATTSQKWWNITPIGDGKGGIFKPYSPTRVAKDLREQGIVGITADAMPKAQKINLYFIVIGIILARIW